MGEQARDEMVNDGNGEIFRNGRRRRRWAGYFDLLLNVEDVIKDNINVGNNEMPLLGELNERAIAMQEVREEANEMKSGKDPSLDGLYGKFVNKGTHGMTVLEWLPN